MENRLHIGNLPATVTDRDLRNKFDRFGRIEYAAVMTDEVTGESCGYGFVHMQTAASAQAAIRWLNSSAFDGQIMAVSLVKTDDRKILRR